MRIVVLSSGGLDSSLLMLMLKKDNHELFPLHINYGQHAEEREWFSCREICKYLEVAKPNRISLSGMETIPSGLTNRNLDIEKDAFLPTRNLLFATFGAAYAYSVSSTVVALGLLANPIFPDQTPEFVRATEACLNVALNKSIRLLTPFITLDKRDTLRLALKHQLPLSITYYCHSGNEKPCGICISCKERIAAESALANEKTEQSHEN